MIAFSMRHYWVQTNRAFRAKLLLAELAVLRDLAERSGSSAFAVGTLDTLDFLAFPFNDVAGCESHFAAVIVVVWVPLHTESAEDGGATVTLDLGNVE